MLHLRHVTLGSYSPTCLSFALPSASALACELSEPQKGTVAEVKDGETLQLTDGTVVRLMSIRWSFCLMVEARRGKLPGLRGQGLCSNLQNV
jgi:hypothetical protein